MSPSPDRPSAQTRFVRPVIAYLAASAAGAVTIGLIITGVEAANNDYGGPFRAARDFATITAIAAMFAFALTPAPVIALTWLAHWARAPRPWTDMLAGAALAPACVVAAPLVVSGETPTLSPRDVRPLLAFAVAGAIAGATYGLLLGPRRRP